MNDCIFCKIIAGEIPSYNVYEDEKVYAFLDIHPAAEYHTLVIPKVHSRDIFDTDPESAAAVIRAVKLLADRYKEKLGIQNVQIINSSGKEAQQDVFHLHFHLVPRREGDGQDVRWATKPEMVGRFPEMLAKLQEA